MLELKALQAERLRKLKLFEPKNNSAIKIEESQDKLSELSKFIDHPE
jgi:hypothetical protein